jgi:hypothetical protein
MESHREPETDPFEEPTFGALDPNEEARRARLVDRYCELTEQIRGAQAELESIKDLVRGFLEDGELVSNGTAYLTYSIRRSYEYDVSGVRATFPAVFDYACKLDPTKVREAIQKGLVADSQLEPLRTVTESKALVLKRHDSPSEGLG